MQTQPFTVEASVSNHFSWIRTRLSIERTLMAWIRTAIALIGFGFTIVQFFQRLQTTDIPGIRPMRPQAPRDLGLALIATGIGVLTIAAWQYIQEIRYLHSESFTAISEGSRAYRRPAFFAAIVLLVIGFAAFISVLFRIS